ncbi:MAG: thioredoxin [Microthrixaceae bacterium]|nr:thioredoxin [Microthrixaceae bacterium]
MVDVTDATFQTEVIERSRTVPVVVDLWAEWCGPCRTLGPIIEKVVADTGGKVELAKVNVDANPRISEAFKVQSIPAVYAIVDGRPVDQFMGALPEDQVAKFVNQLIANQPPSQVELLIEAGDEASLRAAQELEPDNVEVKISLAEFLIGDDRTEEALAILAGMKESADTRRLSALAKLGPVSETDLELRLMALLENVKGDDDARLEFIEYLDLLDDDNPAKAHWRRQLTARLF